MARTVRQGIQQNGSAVGTLRRVQVGNALSAFGSGFTVPYMFVYVSTVRGLGSMTAWLVFTLFALAALAVLPLAGRGIDRYGARPVLITGAVTASAGAFSFGHATGTGHILMSSFLFGAGVAVVQPALATLIVRCSTVETRAHAFAMQFTLVNLGMGIGAMIGGQIVDVNRPQSLTLLFSVEAVMFLVLAGVTGSIRTPAPDAAAPAGPVEAVAPQSRSNLRALLADKAMVRVCLLAGLIFFTCYGQFESGVAAYATDVVGTSPSLLGLALGVNTLAIVALQMIVVRITARRRRSTAIAATGVVWLGAWVAAAVAGLVSGGTIATAAMLSVYMLFGVGEALLAPTLGPIIADLAPGPQLGSYNAAYSLVKQVAVAIGPAAGVLLVGSGLSAEYLALMGGCTVLIVLLALRLRTQLTGVQDNAVRRARVMTGPVESHREPEYSSVA